MEIRVIRLPEMKMVSSGPIRNEQDFETFDKWWSAIDMKNYITPRDFMQFNRQKGCMEQLFAIPEKFKNRSKYALIDFLGGLYAVGTAIDTQEGCEKVRREIHEWVEKSGHFALSNSQNDTPERYELAHVITPKVFKEKCGYHLSDLWVPIVAREANPCPN